MSLTPSEKTTDEQNSCLNHGPEITEVRDLRTPFWSDGQNQEGHGRATKTCIFYAL